MQTESTSITSMVDQHHSIVMDVVGERDAAGWCIVRKGRTLYSGVEPSIPEATMSAARCLATVERFRDSPVYVGNKKLRDILHSVYPNVVKHSEKVPELDLRIAKAKASAEVKQLHMKQQQLEHKREKRRIEAKHRRYVENRLMPRLGAAIGVYMPPRSIVAGTSWLAEDGRHAVHAVFNKEPDETLSEFKALEYLLKAVNKGRLLNVSMSSIRAVTLLENRHRVFSRPSSYNRSHVEMLRTLDAEMEGRDINLTWKQGTNSRLMYTSLQLAEFAFELHMSGGESPEQWRKVDTILMEGIGFDRQAARETRSR